MRNTRISMLMLSSSAIVLAGEDLRAQCAGYSVDILAGPECQFENSSATARALNDAGELCGAYYTCDKSADSAVWLGSGDWIPLTDVAKGTLGFNPFDMNASRQMAGTTASAQGSPLPLAAVYDFDSQTMTNLGMLPGDISSEAFGISNNGRVVGYSTGCGSSCRIHAVIWENGAATVLKLPMGPSQIAHDISESGVYICGWMGIDPHPLFGAHGFVWTEGAAIDLGTALPGCDSTEARGVNNLGQVCGAAYFLPPEGYIRGFFWSDGKMQEIAALPGYPNSFALDLNDSGEVIGNSYDHNLIGEPFVWRDGITLALMT